MKYEEVFNSAFEEVVMLEGGFNNISNDRGGATNYGISLRFAASLPDLEGDIDGNGHVDDEDMKVLDVKTAKRFYFKYFWKHYNCDTIVDDELAKKVFSMFVNMRSRSVGRIVQRALRACGKTLTEDGIIGKQTKRLMNTADQDALMAAIRSEQAGFYRLIVKADESQEMFLRGWLNRAYL